MSSPGPSLAVLMFHHVGPAGAAVAPSLTLAPDRFRRFLDVIAGRGYTPVDSLDVAAWLAGTGSIGPRPVHLTFDDGYAAIARHALPEIVSRRIKATVFVAPATLGGVNAWDGGAEPIMSRDDVRHWAGQGIDFGAHGRTHAGLTTLAQDVRRAEIERSRAELEAVTGRPVSAFAYPYGHHDGPTRALVAEEFRVAFGVEEGLNDRSTDPMRLRRTMVQPGDTVVDFVLRARAGSSALQRSRAALVRAARRKSRG